jgi:hypothetical protein
MAACATDLDLCRRVQPFDEPRPRGRWYVLRAIGRKLLSGSGCGRAQCVERTVLGIIGRGDAAGMRVPARPHQIAVPADVVRQRLGEIEAAKRELDAATRG